VNVGIEYALQMALVRAEAENAQLRMLLDQANKKLKEMQPDGENREPRGD
jgi:hypothetical protein